MVSSILGILDTFFNLLRNLYEFIAPIVAEFFHAIQSFFN